MRLDEYKAKYKAFLADNKIFSDCNGMLKENYGSYEPSKYQFVTQKRKFDEKRRKAIAKKIAFGTLIVGAVTLVAFFYLAKNKANK